MVTLLLSKGAHINAIDKKEVKHMTSTVGRYMSTTDGLGTVIQSVE